MRRKPGGAIGAVTIAVLVAVAGGAWAESAHKLISRGNAAFASGNYDEALTLYEEASVEFPESAQVYFNRGTVFYKQEDYEKAVEVFKEAALRSKDPQLGSRAKFNLGNAAFRQAQRQKDSNLKKAIEYCQESVSYYQEARDLDREYKEAAENIEIVRLFLKVLLDEQKKKQEEQQQSQEQEENLVTKLKKLLERQQALRTENESLAQTKPEDADAAAEETWKNSLEVLGAKQGTLADDTGAVLEEIQQTKSQLEQQAATAGQNQDPSQPKTQPQPSPEEMQAAAQKLGEAEQHTTNAINSERGAAGQLKAGAQSTAGKNQEQAAHYLEEAIKALAGEEEQQQQQGEGEQNQDDQNQKEQGEDQKQEQSGEGEKQEEEQEQEKGDPQEKEDQKQDPQEQAERNREPTEEEKAQARREVAEDILKEARENQKKRRPQQPGRILPVDRDW